MSAVRRLRDDDDVRLVPISRSTYERIHEVQRFLIRLEGAVGEGSPSEPFSSWANEAGAVVAGWQTAAPGGDDFSRAVPREVPDLAYDPAYDRIAYAIFTNDERTKLLRAWPIGPTDSTVPTWRLERASRPDPSATWGIPSDVGRAFGDLYELTEHVAERFGFRSREVEVKRP